MTEQQPRLSSGCICSYSQELFVCKWAAGSGSHPREWPGLLLPWLFPPVLLNPDVFEVVGKVEMGSCIKQKHPNGARSCPRQADVPWLMTQMVHGDAISDAAGLELGFCYPGQGGAAEVNSDFILTLL